MVAMSSCDHKNGAIGGEVRFTVKNGRISKMDASIRQGFFFCECGAVLLVDYTAELDSFFDGLKKNPGEPKSPR